MTSLKKREQGTVLGEDQDRQFKTMSRNNSVFLEGETDDQKVLSANKMSNQMLKMLAKFKNLSVRLSSIPDSVNVHKASKSSALMAQNEPYDAQEVRFLTKQVDGKRILSQVPSDDEETTSKHDNRRKI